MELMRDTIKRDMEEVAAEAVAASTERSNIATELAEGAERISQLGSSIHDLQVYGREGCTASVSADNEAGGCVPQEKHEERGNTQDKGCYRLLWMKWKRRAHTQSWMVVQ